MTIHPLGKRPIRRDARTLKLSDFLPSFTPPATVDWVNKVMNWGIMLNDTLGTCVAAAAGHMVQQWTRYSGVELEHIVPDSKILQSYEKVGGYVPGDPSTDNGMDMLSYLNFWRHHGLGRPRNGHKHRIRAFVSLNPQNHNELRTAIYLFGNVYLGLQLPLSVQGANIWDVPPEGLHGDGAPGSWGGHCVPVMYYSPTDYTVITWGQRLGASNGFIRNYADEAYAVLSHEWVSGPSLSPSGFDLSALDSALKRL